jgi:hypothetical protein
MQIRWRTAGGMLMAKDIALPGGVTAQAIVAEMPEGWQWGVRMRDNDDEDAEWSEHAEACKGIADGMDRAQAYVDKCEQAALLVEQIKTEN